jgi:RNA polymerase sigma factor (sigma-70 family)
MEVAVVTEGGIDVGALVATRLGDSYRLARGILLNDGDAEDAVQEAALTAWRKQRSLREPAKFDAWFDRILVNECRDQLRRRKRSLPLAPPTAVPDRATPITPDSTGDADLERGIARLDVEHRVVVVMRYWQDRTVDDIAERLAIPSGTVKSRLHNALRSLRTSLETSHGRS